MTTCINCGKLVYARQCNQKYCSAWCRSEYRRNNLGICRVEGCIEKAVLVSDKLCHFHYRRMKAGLPLIADRKKLPAGAGTFEHGYVVTRCGSKFTLMHRLIAERALGKPLPKGAVVHHVNGKGWDNRNENLVVCQDDSYHKLLHERQKQLGIVFE